VIVKEAVNKSNHPIQPPPPLYLSRSHKILEKIIFPHALKYGKILEKIK
jgi:hypothetical protein